MRLFKAHGLGNDYIALELDELRLPLSPPVVRLICDRHRGAGSDGILARVPSENAAHGLRIFNPDGTEAEKSGNGLRIFAAYLNALGEVRLRHRFTVGTLGGVVEMEILDHLPADGWTVEVEMGRATFRSAEIGLRGADRETVAESLELPSGERLDCTLVSIGNPHCVVFENHLDDERFRRIAPLLANHPTFLRGANVQFARVEGPNTMEVRVWERGAGETLASGSSACAVAAAAMKRRLVSERSIEVSMPGGALQVEVREDYRVRLRGPVQDVAWIELSEGMISRLRREGGGKVWQDRPASR